MKFDIVFIDPVHTKPYNYETLEEGNIGGTELATIRLAEGFADAGYSTAIVQNFDMLPQTSPKGVKYLPKRWLNLVKPTNTIHLRSRQYFDKFRYTNQIVWMHDVVSPVYNNISDWGEYTKGVKVVSVSDWHTQNIKSICPDLNVTRIYSPMDHTLFNYPKPNKIDEWQLVWLSSPHKGLIEAVDLFEKLRKEVDPRFKLVVFNPGYFHLEMDNTAQNNIRLLSAAPRQILRDIVSQSLCLFYPTQFEETFGFVAAEANALGVPVACYKVAALAESCQNEFCKDEAELIKKIQDWQINRPILNPDQKLEIKNVVQDWLPLLK